jgi:hypothetical protein
MLSSLSQQTKCTFEVDVAYLKDNGTPNTLSVIDFFSKIGVAVRGRPYSDFSRFERRGYTRTDQLRAVTTEWIWFADSDHVLHPEFVERLVDELARHPSESRLFSAGRMSLDPSTATPAVNNTVLTQPAYIPEAFSTAWHLGSLVPRRSCGAGHTQITRVDGIHQRTYVLEGRSLDWPWSTRFQKAQSDIQFRRRCGGHVTLPEWFSRNQIHLNHKRDSDAKVHLLDQR